MHRRSANAREKQRGYDELIKVASLRYIIAYPSLIPADFRREYFVRSSYFWLVSDFSLPRQQNATERNFEQPILQSRIKWPACNAIHRKLALKITLFMCPRPLEIALQSFCLSLKKKEEKKKKKEKRPSTELQRSDDETRSRQRGPATRSAPLKHLSYAIHPFALASSTTGNVNDLPGRQIFRGKNDDQWISREIIRRIGTNFAGISRSIRENV